MRDAFMAALALLVLFSMQVRAETQTPHQVMMYDVYAGGFHVVEAKLESDFRTAGRYDISLSAHTRGFLGSIAPWKGTFETQGWVEDGNAFKPELHKSTTTWQDEVEIKEYNYNRDGTFHSYRVTDEHSDHQLREVDTALTQGTIDALTATLETMQAIPSSQKCEGTSEVFDGKRRYELVFQHDKNVHLDQSKYNIYEGAASVCMVEVKPVSGEWHKKPRGWMSIQEQGRERGTMPTVWMASIDNNSPAVPIKIRVKTEYGTLFMHLTKYRNGESGPWILAENVEDD